jgi:hypothetical protein
MRSMAASSRVRLGPVATFAMSALKSSAIAGLRLPRAARLLGAQTPHAAPVFHSRWR